MALTSRLRGIRSGLASLWRLAPSLSARLALICVTGVVGLAFVQLVLTLCLSSSYVDWFLEAHGMTRTHAPQGEVAGIYLSLGLRVVFSLCWIWSFSKLVEMMAIRDRRTLLMLRVYALVCLVGYGYLVLEGGPWWLTTVRALQSLLGVILGLVMFMPRTARWLSEREAVGKVSDCQSALSDNG